jgi:hypothetical protein
VDVCQLKVVMEKLIPQNNLNSVEGCRMWLVLHSQVAPVITRVMEDFSSPEKMLPLGEWCHNTILQLR